MTLPADEFLRRFLLHLLPKGFVRIRNFGFLANRRRSALLQICFHLLGSAPQPSTAVDGADTDCVSPLRVCPKCGGPMIIILLMAPDTILPRPPPGALVTAYEPSFNP